MLDPRTQEIYRELAAWIDGHCGPRPCPIVGICGAQGSGKSTAASVLQQELSRAHRRRVVVLSLDDFYLPRAARRDLAQRVHPLLATRGVPGTHEVALGLQTLDRLRDLGRSDTLALPRFSKADDDRRPAVDWPTIEGPVDLILFEGWCVGLPAQMESELALPVNDLEAREDADGRWRQHVNALLSGVYAQWFARLDTTIFLAVPDLDCVRRWRAQQEQDTARLAAPSSAGLQSPAQLERFIQHYERLTLHALRVMPSLADAVLRLTAGHAVDSMQLHGT